MSGKSNDKNELNGKRTSGEPILGCNELNENDLNKVAAGKCEIQPKYGVKTPVPVGVPEDDSDLKKIKELSEENKKLKEKLERLKKEVEKGKQPGIEPIQPV